MATINSFSLKQKNFSDYISGKNFILFYFLTVLLWKYKLVDINKCLFNIGYKFIEFIL